MFSRTTTKSMSAGPLSRQRRFDAGKQFHRPQIDVLIELEPQFQQQALFQHARRHVRMADRAQKDGVELSQLVDGAGGQRFAGSQIALAAEIEMLQFVAKFLDSATAFRTLRLRR